MGPRGQHDAAVLRASVVEGISSGTVKPHKTFRCNPAGEYVIYCTNVYLTVSNWFYL